MFNLFKKVRRTEGFTLTETMIGMMILTVAIVSATNLLVGLINSNKNIVESLRAYYFAQEGIELVRNVRDTNWLNNVDWMEGDAAVATRLDFNSTYIFNLGSINKPWDVSAAGAYDPSVDRKSDVYQVKDQAGVGTGFYRHINMLPYECGQSNCDDFVLVQSVVEWGSDSELTLEEVMSNWKGGAL